METQTAKKNFIVVGIGTDVGKTVVSTMLCRKLKADYWKPILSGTTVGETDLDFVSRLTNREETVIHPAKYSFQAPLSPHIAASMEGAEIELNQLHIPPTKSHLVIESAGGILVPLTDTTTNLDLITKLNIPVIIVSKHYLGSINHTLLTVSALRTSKIDIKGIIFNGDELPDSERIIGLQSGVPRLGTIPHFDSITPSALDSVEIDL